MIDNPLIQVIVSLIILLFLGYFAYNIYLIEFEKMLKNQSDIRKEVDVIQGILDFNDKKNVKLETYNKAAQGYVDINPSINQEGGAEYSYNFWLYVDRDNIDKVFGTAEKKDIVLFLKGETKLYHSAKNKNCGNRTLAQKEHINIMIKNPLVKLKPDGTSIVIEYNNIYTPESYQDRSNLGIQCAEIDANSWNSKHKNMLGIYNLDFNRKWFMVTLIMKEVADSNNVLMNNRASCKMYINGLNVLDKKVEVVYNGKSLSATFKSNKSPLHINPSLDDLKDPYKVFGNRHIKTENAVKMADLKYFNYAIDEPKIAEIYSNGFSKKKANIVTAEEARYTMVTNAEMEKNEIKEL
jgi:hypothetical protein